MNRLRTSRIVLAAAMAGGAVMAQANEDGLLTLNASDLMFSINSSVELGLFPIAMEQGASEAVRYDLADGAVQFIAADPNASRYTDPLICFDYAVNSGAVRLKVEDANGHPVADMALGSAMQYVLGNSEIRIAPSSDAQCFYRGVSSGEFGLFGRSPVPDNDDGNDQLFINRFEAVPGVSVEFLDVPSFVNHGQFVNYKVRVKNTGNAHLASAAFQELFPRNAEYFSAVLSSGSWSCSASNGAVCPGGNNDGPLRFEQVPMPPGGQLTFNIGRVVNADMLGSEIDLHAAIVSGSGPYAAFDVAKTTLTLVGEGETLSAESAELQAGSEASVTVTALDAAANPVPGVEIDVVDADGMTVTTTSSETDADGKMEFTVSATEAADYQVVFSAEGMSQATSDVVVTAAAPAMLSAAAAVDEAVANGSSEVVFHVEVEDLWENPVSGAWVQVVDDGGLSELEGAEEMTFDGLAVFSATSTLADAYTVTFGIESLDNVAASARFLAGSPEAFDFFQQPTDTVSGEVITPAVVIRVVDAHGNWVDDDNATEVELLLRQGSATEKLFPTQGVQNGELVYSDLEMDVGAGSGYYLRAMDASRGMANSDSDLFDVLPGPDPDSLSLGLTGFQSSYPQGAIADTGEELVQFNYAVGAGDLEQIFNVFRVYDDSGNEISPGTYSDIFASVGFGPAGYEDYIRGLSGTTVDNVVAPETVDVEVLFELQANAPEGDYELEITSYDVTGIAAENVSLQDANAGAYAVLDAAALEIDIYAHVP